jgi:dTDP-glucose pyrophosphorylase
VVLAAGRGTRMRAAASADLSPAQRAMAKRGLKAMVPVGRPFLDYVLSGLADAGLHRVCLVIGPSHQAVRQYYNGPGRPSRVHLEFAEQAQPLGTADAVLAAEAFAGGAPVVVLNSDNLYPGSALQALRALPRAGLAAWHRSVLLAPGTIPEERINAFALLDVDADGTLTRILEKPSPAEAATFGADPLVSMNAWLLPPTIFAACRAITPSPRGELELQDAVRHCIDALGERFQVVAARGAVLDLSHQGDIPVVAERLRALEARP